MRTLLLTQILSVRLLSASTAKSQAEIDLSQAITTLEDQCDEQWRKMLFFDELLRGPLHGENSLSRENERLQRKNTELKVQNQKLRHTARQRLLAMRAELDSKAGTVQRETTVSEEDVRQGIPQMNLWTRSSRRSEGSESKVQAGSGLVPIEDLNEALARFAHELQPSATWQRLREMIAQSPEHTRYRLRMLQELSVKQMEEIERLEAIIRRIDDLRMRNKDLRVKNDVLRYKIHALGHSDGIIRKEVEEITRKVNGEPVRQIRKRGHRGRRGRGTGQENSEE